MNEKVKGILKAIVFIILYLGVYLLGQVILLKVLHLENELARGINYVWVILFLLGYLKVTKKFHLLHWNVKKVLKSLLLIIPLIPIMAFFFALGIPEGEIVWQKTGHIIYWLLIFFIGAGFTEELVTRGVILNTLLDSFGRNKKSSIIISCLLAALLFGLSHIINYFGTGSIPYLQMFLTIGLGIVMGSIYIRTKSIWGVAIVHGLWDIIVSFDKIFFVTEETTSSSGGMQPGYFIIGFIFILYCIGVLFFYTRKKKEKEYLEG